MAMNRIQRQVSLIVLAAIGGKSFALGGGQAAVAHGVIERESEDLDFYTNRFDAQLFDECEQELREAARRAGFRIQILKTNDVFRAINFTNEAGEGARVDLGYDDRHEAPVRAGNLDPVLAPWDVAHGKVRAMLDRGEPRDFADVVGYLRSGLLRDSEIEDIFHRQLTGRDDDDLAYTIGRLTQITDREWRNSGLSAESPAAMIRELARIESMNDVLRRSIGDSAVDAATPRTRPPHPTTSSLDAEASSEGSRLIWVKPHERNGHHIEGHWRRPSR